MQDTYHVDHQNHRRRKVRRRWTIVIIALLLLLGGYLWAMHNIKADTVIQQSQPFTTTVGVPETKLKIFEQPTFQVQLPSDWSTVVPTESGVDYSWRGTAQGETARSLDVYVDEIPADKALNRLLPIRVEGTGVLPTDDVSDNCINFTDPNTANPHTGAAPSKWSGVSFTCDTANKQRVVVGTSSATEPINTVTITGAKGTHKYFFVYTDHSAQPKFEIFTNALETFKAL
jgi:hypothetical protein